VPRGEQHRRRDREEESGVEHVKKVEAV